jgi:hypothetical protein
LGFSVARFGKKIQKGEKERIDIEENDKIRQVNVFEESLTGKRTNNSMGGGGGDNIPPNYHCM